MKSNYTIPVILAILVSCVCSCSSSESDGDKTFYTPVSLYFNPLDDNLIKDCLSEYPYFVNYPDDWKKFGLHGRPNHVFQNSKNDWMYIFNLYGNFHQINDAYYTYRFVYEDGDKLVKIMKGSRQSNVEFTENKFEYRDSLMTGNGIYCCTYYDNGKIKEVGPERGLESQNDGSTLGILSFDMEGRLVKHQARFTSNPFIADAKSTNTSLPSVSTFKYDERGLCVEKNEMVYKTVYRWKEEDQVDTIPCVSRYEYDGNGNLTKWEYEGGCYESKNGNSYSITNRRFTIDYEYECDDYGNWTERRILLPLCYKEIPALAWYYQMQTAGFAVRQGGAVSIYGETPSARPVITQTRSLPYYYEYTAEDLGMTGKKNQADDEKGGSDSGTTEETADIVDDSDYEVAVDDQDNEASEEVSYKAPALPENIANSIKSEVGMVEENADRKGLEIADVDPDKAAPATDVDYDQVFTATEKMPEFPGGQTAMMNWIGQHLKYPATAHANHVQGRVVVKFVVKKDGSVGNVVVVRGKDPDLDKEAVRVVKSLPAFTPGTMNGKPVAVWYTLPINFRLSE